MLLASLIPIFQLHPPKPLQSPRQRTDFILLIGASETPFVFLTGISWIPQQGDKGKGHEPQEGVDGLSWCSWG